MIKIIVYVEDPLSSDKSVELAGLSKRLNTIGLQPIPGDQFSCDYLNNEDKEKLEQTGHGSTKKLIVTSRVFRFENSYSALYVTLSPN